MVRVKVLGSASGIASKDRACVSILITSENGTNLLIDCGEPCAARLLQCGEDPKVINAIFLSHLHCDHSAGLPLLIQTMYLSERVKPLDIFVPSEGVSKFKKLFEMFYLIEDVLPFSINLAGIEEETAFPDSSVTVKAFANRHFEAFLSRFSTKYPDNLGQSYSFLIETGTARIGYSGDISRVTEIDSFIGGKDLLIIEAAHIKPEDIFSYLAGKDVRNVLLIHLHPDLEGRVNEIVESGEKLLGFAPLIARDGTEINV